MFSGQLIEYGYDKKLFIVDSKVISLFKIILKIPERPRKDDNTRGDIKVNF
jgi:hypothetical protein